MDPRLLAFLGVAALLTVSPGPDMALVMRNALRYGSRAVLPTSAGIAAGSVTWGAISSLGVAALLAASAQLYQALKLAGAIYLVFLGAVALRAAWTSHRADDPAAAPREAVSGRVAFRQGILTNLLNPKVGVFYATFLPQFIGPGQPVFATSIALASIHAAMGLAWLNVYGRLASRLGDLLRGGRVRRAVESLTGAVLIAFGLRLAVDRG